MRRLIVAGLFAFVCARCSGDLVSTNAQGKPSSSDVRLSAKASIVPADDEGTWSRQVIDERSSLYGGPFRWQAGTSIAVRADGQPIVAYYDSSYHCNNGGYGTYTPDALMVARTTGDGWTRTVEACGPEVGYWPRMRV